LYKVELRERPNVTLLFTSREPLIDDLEQPIHLEPLALPPANAEVETIADLKQYAATHLFYQRAQLLAYSKDDIHAVRRLCELLDGLPLAIKLLASQVNKKKPPTAVYVSFIKHGIWMLDDPNKDLDPAHGTKINPRHISLAEAIQWSYNLLSQDEQKLFRRLSIFRRHFDGAAVQEICSIAGDIQESIRSLLKRLIKYSLVQEEDEDDYTLLQPIRRYAQQKLREEHEEKIIDWQHASYSIDQYLANRPIDTKRLFPLDRGKW